MDIDKTAIAISMALVAVIALAAFSASFPAMADDAAQDVSVAMDTASIDFMDQAGTSAITGWAFSGTSGTTVQPTNSESEAQEAGTTDKAVSRLKNTASVSMDVYLYSDEFNDTDVAQVANERMNVTASTANASISEIDQTISTSCPGTATTTIPASGTKDLWLKLTLGGQGAATATFHADSEVS